MPETPTWTWFNLSIVFSILEFSTHCLWCSHMDKVVRLKKGDIVIGSMITSLVEAFSFGAEIRWLKRVKGKNMLDLNSCLEQNMIKKKVWDAYIMITRNKTICNMVFLYSRITNMQDEENCLYKGDIYTFILFWCKPCILRTIHGSNVGEFDNKHFTVLLAWF